MMIDSEDDDSNFESEKKKKSGPSTNRSVPKACFLRENGARSEGLKVAKELEWAAEDIFVQKVHKEHRFQLPENARSTFLMVFSPDGKIVASTHGNHSIYVTDVRTCKTIRTLNGHPRTPWCIAFHPSSNQILASGCLGGEVRVWDLHGGSEIWTSDCHTVIASLAFHPIERVLVIATYNELYFWDWSEKSPFAKCRTGHDKEKIRYVAFDHLGQKLITGIANVSPLQSQWDRIAAPSQNDPEDCLRRMLSERNRERPRENFNFSNSLEESPSVPSLSDRLASWNPSVRRQALAEMRLPYRNNFRSHNVRRLRSTSSSSLLHNTLRPCVNWRHPTLRPEQFSLSSSNQRDRDRFSIENYLLGNRDFTLNDFISVVGSQSENGSSHTTSDGDHNYSESEQNGSIEYWRVLLDFFFDEAYQESGFGRSNRNDNETESLFTDHDYSASREQFARSRHTWWSRNIDEEQPGDAAESASDARQNSSLPLRSMSRWTRAPLPPLSTLEHSSSAPDSSVNEASAPGDTHSAFFVRSMSRLQTQLRRLQKTLSYLESQSSAIRDRAFRSEPGSSSSVRRPSSLQGLSPLVLQPLSEPQVQPGLWSSRRVLNVEAIRVDSVRLLQFITYRRPASLITRQRLQSLLQRMHQRLAEIQAAAQGLSSQTPNRESSTVANSNSSSNSVLWGPSSSVETPEESSRLSFGEFMSAVLNSQATQTNASSDNRDVRVPIPSTSSPNRQTPHTLATHLRPKRGSLESARRRYLEERIKTLRQLADVNRCSPANPPSSSSQEPRAFQNYTPKPSCSRTNEASDAESLQTPSSLLSKGKQLSYFEKLKAKFAQLSRQIKEQCAASASEFSSEYWKTPGASTSQSSDDISSSSDRTITSDSVNPDTTRETVIVRSEANSRVRDTSNPEVSNNSTERLNSIGTSLSRVNNALGQSASCEYGADSLNPSDEIAQTVKKNKSDKVGIDGTNSGALRNFKRRSSCGERNSETSFHFGRLNNSENGCGASSSSSSDNLGDSSVAPLKRSISSFLGSLRRSSSVTSSSTSSSNESWQGPISEVGNTPNSSTKQDQQEPAPSPSQEKRRLTLKRKLDTPVLLNSSQSTTNAAASSSTSSPRADLVATLPALRPDLPTPSSSTTSCSDSSSTSSSESDNQDPQANLLQNFLSSVRQNPDLFGALQDRQHVIRRARNRAAPPPCKTPATPSSASLQATLSDSSRYMESLFGGPSRNVRRRTVEEIGTQIRTFVYLFQEYLEQLTHGTAGTRTATITVLQDISRLVFHLADFWFALSEREAEEGESSRSPRLEDFQERERLLFSEINAFQRDLMEAPIDERRTSEINGESRPSRPFMRLDLNSRETNGGTSNDRSPGTGTLIDTSPGDRRVRRERIDLARERQLIRIRMELLRERTERLSRFAYERRNRRQSLRERLDENRVRRERALRELRELGEQIRESRGQDFLRRRQLLRETRELGRQNHQIIRSLIEAADRAQETSAVSSAELLRSGEGASATRDSSSGSVSPSPQQSPVSSRLSDPMLQQFNNLRPLSLSPQQREQRSFSSHSSPGSSLQRPILCVPLVRVNDQPVNLPAESNEPSQRNRTRSPPLFFAPDSMVEERGSLGPEDSRPFFGRSFQSSSIDDPGLFPDTPRSYFTRRSIPNELRISLHHRIQAWDFSKWTPCSALDIKNPQKNLVVADCKIYNDASVDISSDSSLLVTLLPSSRFGFTCMLGIYSLDWETLGQRLYVVSFEQNAVSVSLSPTCRYLVVGLSARRRTSLGTENDTVAQILRLDGAVPSRLNGFPQKGKLTEVRELELYRELSSMSLNCIRWAPTPGQGIVCGTNTGQLTFLR